MSSRYSLRSWGGPERAASLHKAQLLTLYVKSFGVTIEIKPRQQFFYMLLTVSSARLCFFLDFCLRLSVLLGVKELTHYEGHVIMEVYPLSICFSVTFSFLLEQALAA